MLIIIRRGFGNHRGAGSIKNAIANKKSDEVINLIIKCGKRQSQLGNFSINIINI
jgi:hypothetical protein